MTAKAKLLGLPRDWLLIAAPLLVILVARLAFQSPIAATYPRVAALLLLWLVSDALMLSLVARHAPAPISRRAVVGVLAGAAVTTILIMPAPLRSALLTLPVVAALMAMVVAGHVVWGLIRAKAGFDAATGEFADRAVAALAELGPPVLARFVVAEVRLLHVALLQWRAEPDVPAGSIGFGYHKHLLPICSVILVLQLCELGVVHLLVAIWNPTAAIILSALSAVGMVYLIGLLKSFRLKPVLVQRGGIRVRAGILIDRQISFNAIANVRTSFTSEEIKRADTNEAGLLAWPNIFVELSEPVADPGPFRPNRKMRAIAFRLDEPSEFVRVVKERVKQARLA